MYMNCNCTWVESLLAVIVIVFAFWQTSYSQWVIVIAAALLLIHGLWCKNCKACKSEMHQMKPTKKKK